MFLLVHAYFVAGTVCKSSAHDTTLKFGSFCPRFMTHEFKPAEFHTTWISRTWSISRHLDQTSLANNPYIQWVRIKETLSRIFSFSLNNQNTYLCRRKPTNNGSFFVNNCYISPRKLLASVFGCRWPGWKRIAT